MERHTGRPIKPLLLWLDFAFSPQEREFRVACARFFRVAYTTRLDRALEDVASLDPAVLCFEFDHLDEPRLQTLQDVMRVYARLPVLMLTADHSEALAVWAFRAGVWNYLVRPVSFAEFSENLAALAQITARGSPLRAARPPGLRLPRDFSEAPVDAHVAQLQPALQYVRRHYSEKISENEAARRCGTRRFAFSRHFHAAFGLTFREYVMHARIAEARRLLAEGDNPVTEVAFATGFNDGSHFARMFKRYTGELPSEYRLRARAQ